MNAASVPVDIDEILTLVDERDEPVGFMGKLEVHRKGLLHRAFSIMVFDSQGRWLLQRRADKKYHSAGLWSNTCCGHPRPGEDIRFAAQRRLREEMGFTTELAHVGSMQYFAKVSDELVENEYDHIFVGLFTGPPCPDPREVGEFAWLSRNEVHRIAVEHPQALTVWFRLLLARAESATGVPHAMSHAG